MQFVVLRFLRHNELGMFHSYRRLGKERAKQRAINFDSEVVDRLFPAARDSDSIDLLLRYQTDVGTRTVAQQLNRQAKNWRLEGNCPVDRWYDFVDPGCLFAMVVDAGRRPAAGAWAVYPGDDPAALAISACAESGQLAGRSMIALHGHEGERTLDILRERSPELFAPENLTMTSSTAPGQSPSNDLPPDPRRLVNILASVGHRLPSAVADIVDNAISKEATEIRIVMGALDDGHGRWMTITDNGTGMDASALEEAMRIGSGVQYDSEDLGKYGYGLKGASWSQTDSFSVVTRRKGEAAHHLSWDKARMDSWKKQDEPLEDWTAKATDVGEHGTSIIWRDMRPPKRMPAIRGISPQTAELLEVEQHLGLVFHRFIEGRVAGRRKVSIRVGGTPVQANNPVGHAKVSPYDLKTIRVPTAQGHAAVRVQPFLLPSEQEVKDLHGVDGEAADRDLGRIGLHGRRNESQGVYVYRNNRLIQWGGWHGIWMTSDEKTKLARVVVDFGSELDDHFKVNISKQSVELSHQLLEEVKKLATTPRTDSRNKYKLPPEQKKRPAVPPIGPAGAQNGAAGRAQQALPMRGQTSIVPIRQVKTSSFAWKVGTGMAGNLEVQVSETETELTALLELLGDTPDGRMRLAAFLKRLDQAEIQPLLLARPPQQ
ncbi:MAG: ATP-binding protein [Comamonadaceae bacterium]|nr:MAG: ATP-binding protein [Comamonadaceae bacterium]